MHRKLHSKTNEGSDGSAELARSSGSRSSTLDHSSNHYDASDSSGREGDTESSFASRLLRNATFSASPLPIDHEAQGLWELHRAPTGILTSLQWERSASPAAQSLQRLKQLDKSKTYTNLRRLSENFSSTIQRLRPRTQDPSRKDGHAGLAREAQPSRQRRPDQREENLSNPNRMMARKLPSIITLRRATLESTPVVADDSSSNVEMQGKSPSSGVTSDSKATGSELVAFRSMPLAKSDTNSPSSRRRSMYEGHEALQAQLEASQSRSKVFDLASGWKVTARKASAGEALTKTDVHITPGTFHDEARTVKSSKASSGSPRRLSVVQIVSCDTVNAIIWREEESPSSGSSTQTPSPRRIEPDTPGASVDSRRMVKINSALPRDAVADQMDLERQGNRKLSREVNMFEWSWGKNFPSSRVALDDNKPQLPDLESGDTFAAMHPSILHVGRKRAAVESFPPLLDRTSTADWQTMPFLISQGSESYSCAPSADVDGEREEVAGPSRKRTARAKLTSGRKRQSIAEASRNSIDRERLGSCVGSSAGRRIQKRASVM
ncbi:MAG: hypothetical protein OHK93_004072 [Ramalina farinacea]|uniref:Uncharacterized protein n=1 Tax=Ramalina farinacea TaxID=258253 RepID=A0AA43TRR6_9LECA|nr:hypothetical protein [Ramalina farinacea]